jgi:hypothetical protein
MKNQLIRGTGFGFLLSLALWALIITIALVTINWMHGGGKPTQADLTAGKPAASPAIRADLHSADTTSHN